MGRIMFCWWDFSRLIGDVIAAAVVNDWAGFSYLAPVQQAWRAIVGLAACADLRLRGSECWTPSAPTSTADDSNYSNDSNFLAHAPRKNSKLGMPVCGQELLVWVKRPKWPVILRIKSPGEECEKGSDAWPIDGADKDFA
jgi:hypothetical protein